MHILINKPGLEFDLYVVENGISPLIKISDESLVSLIKQAKVKPNIHVINDQDISAKIESSKLNRYSFDKFYLIFIASTIALYKDFTSGDV